MDTIFQTNDDFNFNNLKLTKPTQIPGGNYFIKCSIDDKPLYIQPPKCNIKQGILKAGKRFYTDLLFDNINDDYIRWMENLVNHCQHSLFKNREEWFDGNMEMHEIENYFTSPVKPFKSGKYYLTRVNISSNLGNISTTIYDEDENVVHPDNINENSTVITILEVSGIKCTATCFQLEFNTKQLLLLKPIKMFEKCIIKMKVNQMNNVTETNPVNDCNETNDGNEVNATNDVCETNIINDSNENNLVVNTDLPINQQPEIINNENLDLDLDLNMNKPEIVIEQTNEEHHIPQISTDAMIEEITFNVEDLPLNDNANDNIKLKQRNDIYYEMYREARRKSKSARDLALSTYLEAKRIKNTYMLSDIDDSDSDNDSDNTSDDKNIYDSTE
jgi:hypothetical protein